MHEEVVVRKDATERTETVKDTVRRTEVEVEDSGTGSAARAATPGSTTSGFGTEPTGPETPADRDAESKRPSPEKGTVKQ